jgi:hypothetical protein
MSIRKVSSSLPACAALLASLLAIVNIANAGAREEGRVLTATEVLEEVKACPISAYPTGCCSVPTASP